MSPEFVTEKSTEGGATSTEVQIEGTLVSDPRIAPSSRRIASDDDLNQMSRIASRRWPIPGDFENCEWGSRQATDQGFLVCMHGTERRFPRVRWRESLIDRLEQGVARVLHSER